MIRLRSIWPTVVAGALLLAALGGPSSARANPNDMFGMGHNNMGRMGAGLVLADGPFATYMNPSGMGYGDASVISVGAHWGWMRFKCFDEAVK